MKIWCKYCREYVKQGVVSNRYLCECTSTELGHIEHIKHWERVVTMEEESKFLSLKEPKIGNYTLFNFQFTVKVDELNDSQIDQLRKLSLSMADTIERLSKASYAK